MKRAGGLYLFVFLTWAVVLNPVRAEDPTRIFVSRDGRLGKPKTLNDYFPLAVPASKEAWEQRRKEVREQVLVATGLWPMPDKTPLSSVIHGRIDRDDYTIEKVFFASYPGHYVCGNLYRPKGKNGKLAGVLCPHGHWPNGRFFERNDAEAKAQIAKGAEKTMEGAKYPLQARAIHLARMGCVVFFYDMVGYADSQQITHRTGFTDVESELRLQNFMGLQTFNSIRALDFLLSLPDVDPQRIGVTGASGGGTQTFMLCGVDDRVTAAFPAVMVSTAMQGGCICENCSYLRQNTGNIELTGLFAPKPVAMSGANDWTIDIETKGLPELKALYKLYGAEDKVAAKCFPEFEHNYNQVSREYMYNWFNKHLHLGQSEPVMERSFVPVPPKQLSVYDDQHPLPKDAVKVEALRKYMTQLSDKQLAALKPKDAAGLQKYRQVMSSALRVMVNDKLPASDQVEETVMGAEDQAGVSYRRMLLGRKGYGEQIPAVLISSPGANGKVVVWVHPAGKSSLFDQGKLIPTVQQILDKKTAILALDAFQTGENQAPAEINKTFAGYTFGYNRPILANRVHDILTAIAFARGMKEVKSVDLLGLEKAGPWALLARALSGDAVQRTAIDVDDFRFEDVKTMNHEMMLPGALKYGGLPALAALCAPGELFLYNHKKSGVSPFLRDVYRLAGAPDKIQENPFVDWLTR